MTSEEQQLWDYCIRTTTGPGSTFYIDEANKNADYSVGLANRVIAARRLIFPAQATTFAIAAEISQVAREIEKIMVTLGKNNSELATILLRCAETLRTL